VFAVVFVRFTLPKPPAFRVTWGRHTCFSGPSSSHKRVVSGKHCTLPVQMSCALPPGTLWSLGFGWSRTVWRVGFLFSPHYVPILIRPLFSPLVRLGRWRSDVINLSRVVPFSCSKNTGGPVPPANASPGGFFHVFRWKCGPCDP